MSSAAHQTPSIRHTSFNCPHCGALAHQTWFLTYVDALKKDYVPFVVTTDEEVSAQLEGVEEEDKAEHIEHLEKLKGKYPFIKELDNSIYTSHRVSNLHISRCYSCDRLSIWIADKAVWPTLGTGPAPNADLPDDIKRDFEEASSIVSTSPRGAAALARLCVQKLCKHAGQPGKNINEDIATLVKNGLDPQIQKALDVVRIVGNNAVHPGEIDLQDDVDTAQRLLMLVNVIANELISRPKVIADMFGSLPKSQVDAIAKRDSTTPP